MDAQGYDLIHAPPGSTLGHDGQQLRVFTKPEYRVAADGGQRQWAAGQRPRSDGGSTTGSSGRWGRQPARRVNVGQQTLEEFVRRAGE